MGHVVAHLRDAVQGSSRRPVGLVIVAVDKAQVAAQAVVELAASYASQGRKVVVADLSDGAHAARLLRIKGSGIHAIRQDGVEFLLTVPDRDDVAPTGPLQPGTSAVGPDRANEELIAACSSADILLTVATLEPAFGADYLVTWADRAVAVVTTGCSTEVRVHAAGEMIRLAGMRLVSVMLIGADKSDESLGATRTADQLVPARSARDSSWRDTAILPPPVRA
jgi:hypothetical protein